MQSRRDMKRVHGCLLIAMLVPACNLEGGAAKSRQALFRECEEPPDLDRIRAIIEQTTTEDLHCFVSEDCQCGTYCDEGFCTADCLTTDDPDYGCSGDQECDLWGRCDVPGAPPPPRLVTIEVDPLSVDVAPVLPGQEYATATVEVVASASEEPDSPPEVRVRGNATLRVECPGNAPECEGPDEETVRELEVKCEDGSAFAEECTLGSWEFTSDGDGVRATRTVEVRPRSDAQESAWQLGFDGADVASPQSVSLVRRGVEPQPLEGAYVGRMTISRRGAPVPLEDLPDEPDAGPPPIAAEPADLVLKVTALVEDGHVLVVEPARVVTPSGKIRLGQPGTSANVEWMSRDGLALVGTLTSDLLEHDATRGHVRARYSLTLPLHYDDAAPAVEALLELDRRGPVSAPACTANGGCAAAGQSCDAVLERCLSGPTFTTTELPAGNSLSAPAFLEWGVAAWLQMDSLGIGYSQFLGDDFVERLQCHDGAGNPKEAVFGRTVMAMTGDLRCDQAAEPFPAGLRLLNAIDASGGSSASADVGQLLAQCRNDLAQPVPPAGAYTLGNAGCLGLARVLPGIGFALSRVQNGRAGTRTAGLAQHLLRGWVTAGAFAAQQGLESVDLGEADPSAPQTDLVALLDSVDRTWHMLTDGFVAGTLATLAPRRLANPDYRGTNRPKIYWARNAATDVAGGSHNLGPPPRCDYDYSLCGADAATVDPSEVDLSGDLTVAMEIDLDLANGHRQSRTLIESPWITASIHPVNPSYLELDYRRGSPLGTPVTPGFWTTTWDDCHDRCVTTSSCTAWSFNTNAPILERCFLHQPGYADHVYAPGWISNVLTEQGRFVGDQSEFRFVEEQAARSGGADLEVTVQPDWGACYQRCYQNDQCASFTYNSTGQGCQLKASVPATSFCATCTSDVMPQQTLTVGHHSPENRFASVSFPIARSLLRAGGKQRVVIVRSMKEHAYRMYMDGTLIGVRLFGLLPQPTRGKPRPFYVGRRDGWVQYCNSIGCFFIPTFENVGHVALWDSALDQGEVLSMQSRQGDWASRGQVTLPGGESTVNHDQARPLAVSLLETVTRHVNLLEAYLASVEGPVYGECVTGQSSALRDQVQERVGRTLRSAFYVEELASRMHDRGREVECDRDVDCPDGSRCGPGARIHLDALTDGVRTGTMQDCIVFWRNPIDWGLCSTWGNPTDTPGDVGTATFTFTVPAAGSYAIWGKVATEPNMSRFWIRADGQAWIAWNPEVMNQPHVDWFWSQAATVELAAGTHTITVGVRDGWAKLRELVVATADGSGSPDDLGDVCYAGEEPLLSPVAGPADEAAEKTFRAAVAGLDAAMQRAVIDAGALGECRNPLGIEEVDLPLYFMDMEGGPVQRHFAASLYLRDLAVGALGSSSGALEQVRSAWNQKRLEKYQTETEGLDNRRRVEAIASQYSDELEDLCGTTSALPGGLLMEFKNGRDPATCFVKVQNPICETNFSAPIAEANHACYQGGIGQALLGMKQAHFAMEGARIQRDSKQREYDAKAKLCAHRQGTARIIEAHLEHMESMRKKKGWFDKIAGVAGLVASVSTGTGALAVARNLYGAVGEKKQPGGVGTNVGKLLEMASGATSLLGTLTAGSEIADEKAKFEAQMAERENEADIMECFAQADRLHDEIALADSAIGQQLSEFEQATMTFAGRRARVEQVVVEGLAGVAREEARTIALPYHHYWLDERIERYQREMSWARRLVYLLLRAVEYDTQQSLSFRDEVLAAANPNELEAAFQEIDQVLAEHEVGPRGGDPQGRVIEMTMRRVMGIPSNDTVSFGQHLLSPASYIYDPAGNLVGRGVRFQITPTSAFLVGHQIINDCAEKYTRLTGSVQITGGSTLTRVPFVLMQANTFASQECVPASQPSDGTLIHASHRPSENLFEPGGGAGTFQEVAQRTAATVSNFPNLSPQDLSGGDAEAVSTDLAGRGVHGDYVFVIREDVARLLPLASVTDVLIRIDYTGVENGLVASLTSEETEQ
jgi:hypothetical protein